MIFQRRVLKTLIYFTYNVPGIYLTYYSTRQQEEFSNLDETLDISQQPKSDQNKYSHIL
jgi:hypothetical protein